jgi:hypothetical protein
MALFGVKPLPPTSYGYQPPRGATTKGWRCVNEECGVSELGRVARWPFRCLQCGWAADPTFDPPWEHEALGVELAWQVGHDASDAGRRLAGERLLAWRLKDALLLRGDARAAADARAELRSYVSRQVRQGGWWSPGFTLLPAVQDGLDAGDLDGAAEDLCFWLDLSTGEGAADDNEIRTNARSVISSGAVFLDAPGAAAHPRARDVRVGCLRVAEGVFTELTAAQQNAITRMATGDKPPTWTGEPVRARPRPGDRISAEHLARFGRYLFLDSKMAGGEQQDSFSWIQPLASLLWAGDQAHGRLTVVAELRRHAAAGEWEKVGAWKFVREFLDDAADTRSLIDEGLLAVARMRVTNLRFNLAPVDMPRYAEVTAGPVPDDGFIGPPSFDSGFGPSRQYYLDSATAAAERRSITRLPHNPGAAPGAVADAARSMWDFGILIYRGPLVISPDLAFEPNVVRRAVAAASGADHVLFMDMLETAVLDPANRLNDHMWTSLGSVRFAEDYLSPHTLDTRGFRVLLDVAVNHLIRAGEPGRTVAPGMLTPIQRHRLATSAQAR